MSSRSARILIADPDPAFVDVLSGAFARDDCYLVASAELDEALEWSRTESFDVMICDAALDPIGKGLPAMIARIKKARPKLPVIATSSSGDSGDTIEAIKAGAYDYLPKPVEVEELRRVVLEAIAARHPDYTPDDVEHDLFADPGRRRVRRGAQDGQVGPLVALIDGDRPAPAAEALETVVLVRACAHEGRCRHETRDDEHARSRRAPSARPHRSEIDVVHFFLKRNGFGTN